MGKKKKLKGGKPHSVRLAKISGILIYCLTLVCVKPPYMVLKYLKYSLKSVKG